MIYEIVRKYGVPVKWVINDSKGFDGTDFTYNGVNYKGGTFIIPAEFRNPTIDGIITSWEGQGVVGVTTTSAITVPVFLDIRVMPRWTMDAQNGGIAIGYLEEAGIPTDENDPFVAFNEKDPLTLDCCDDIFVMPHADPEWETHSRLYSWNGEVDMFINGEEGCEGAIWLACHAGSALELMFNPADPTQQTNFLSQKTGVAQGGGPWAEPDNSLVIWGDHDGGTLPYTAQYPTDPIMQYMGTIDGGQESGSEQIYIPVAGGGWNPGAKVYVYEPNHPDASGTTLDLVAGKVISGRAFDDPERGRVMLEAAHTHAGGDPENIAAQRVFFNFSILTANEKALIPDVTNTPDDYVAGEATPLSFEVPPGTNVNNLTIEWTSSCGGTFSPPNTQSTIFTPPPNPTNCVVKVEIIDQCGRVIVDAKQVEIVCEFAAVGTPNAPSCNGFSDGSIDITVADGLAPYTYDYGTGSVSGTTIPSLAAGTYNVTVNDSGGCETEFTTTLADPPVLTLSTTQTDVECFGQATGAINLTVSGGTTPYTYLWNDAVTTKNRSNIPAGTYTVDVTDANGCTDNTSVTITENPGMSLSSSITPADCVGEASGAIDLTVTGASGSPTFNWSNGASSEDLTNVLAGSYTVDVTDASGCTSSATYVVGEPAAALSATATMINVSCNGNSDGSIDLSPTGGTPPYSFLWSNAAIVDDIAGLAAGTYTVDITDDNGCTFTLSKDITEPAPLSLSTSVSNATCPSDSDGVIDLTVAGGTSPYTFDWSNDGLEPIDDDLEDLTEAPGTYSVVVTDANGCTATTSATIAADNTNPSAPTSIGN
jgi:hypothetical protein